MSAEMPRHASVVLSSRRRALQGLADHGGHAVGGLFRQFQPAQFIHLASAAAAERAGAARRHHRHRRGQGRPHPAAVGGRQCRHRRPVDAQRRRNGDRRVQCPQHHAPPEGRRRHRRSGAARRPAGARRRRRDHPRAVVCAIGQRRRASGAGAQHPGHRVFDRRQCGVRWRLSVELPAGIRRRAHRAICRLDRETLLRRPDPG